MPKQRHSTSGVWVALVILLLSACSAGASSSPTPGDASPSADPTSSAAQGSDASPPPAGLPSGPFAWNQLLVVTADGLAVRRGPSTSAELAFAAPWDTAIGDWVGTTEEVRLDVGYEVRVSLGPIRRDGFDWYEVTNSAEPGTESDVVQWDADGDGIYFDPGWIAAAEGEAMFVEPVPVSGEVNPPLLFAAGSSGSYLSESFRAGGEVGGTWVLVTDDLAPCDLTVILEPSGQRLVEASLIGVYEYGSLGAADLPAGEYQLRVTAGVDGYPDAACDWSLVLFQSVS